MLHALAVFVDDVTSLLLRCGVVLRQDWVPKWALMVAVTIGATVVLGVSGLMLAWLYLTLMVIISQANKA